ncbi:MAG: hypothetical protein DRP87_12280 [Spirochaetes bacterium]|nr:MAG: hypothetical protein DRP87_12280 [Spirochaetota bacterium]
MNNDIVKNTAQLLLDSIPLVMKKLFSELRKTGEIDNPVQYKMLCILSGSSKNLAELAERQGVSPPTMSRSISRMVNRGWIRRTSVPEDRRKLKITITDDGKRVLDSVHMNLRQYVEQLVAELPEDKLQKLREGLEILKQSFEIRE